jgi:hypothetical protein
VPTYWEANKSSQGSALFRTLSHRGAAIYITASTSGLVQGLRRGSVKGVTFAHFARDRGVCVRSDALSDFEAWGTSDRLIAVSGRQSLSYEDGKCSRPVEGIGYQAEVGLSLRERVVQRGDRTSSQLVRALSPPAQVVPMQAPEGASYPHRGDTASQSGRLQF